MVKKVANNLRLYVLADKLQFLQMLPVIMDCIRSGLFQISGDFFPEEIEYIYDNAAPSFELRRLAIQRMAFAFISHPCLETHIRLCLKRVPEFASD